MYKIQVNANKGVSKMMLGKKDKPSYYNIIGGRGEIIATVSKSQVFKKLIELEKKLGKKLKIILKE